MLVVNRLMLVFEQFALKLPISDQWIERNITPTRYELFINRVLRGLYVYSQVDGAGSEGNWWSQ